MNLAITYFTYLGISVAVTVWVARTLHHRGRIFLVDALSGEEKLADSVNDLLVVGFYLINLGYICLVLKYGTKPTDLAEAIEFLSTKIGLVLMILGVMHFINLLVLNKMRRRTQNRNAAPPARPTPPDGTDYGKLKDIVTARIVR